MTHAPRFTIEELWAIEDDARACLLDENQALHHPDRWLGLVIDLSRSLRSEHEFRVHGPAAADFDDPS